MVLYFLVNVTATIATCALRCDCTDGIGMAAESLRGEMHCTGMHVDSLYLFSFTSFYFHLYLCIFSLFIFFLVAPLIISVETLSDGHLMNEMARSTLLIVTT